MNHAPCLAVASRLFAKRAIVIAPAASAVAEGELWARAAAELALEGDLAGTGDAGSRDAVEALLATTVLRIEQDKGEAFAGLFEAAARATLAAELISTGDGRPFWSSH